MTSNVTRVLTPSRDRSAPTVLPFRQPSETPPEALVEPAAKPARPVNGWDNATLRIKVTLLVLLAAVGGVGVGMVEAHLGHLIWPLAAGLALLAFVLLRLASRWAWRPLEQLVENIEGAEHQDRPTVLATLPVTRGDEVGKLARVLHRFSVDATRDHNEARRLRRTIDERVNRATHIATRNLKELTMRDPLTDLGNRRFLDENLPRLFESCVAADADLVCIAIDVDNFKPLNDTLGHSAGDDLLRSLASLIRATIRHEDYAVRLGGDEFIILMPDCPLTRARDIGEQLLALFRQHARVTIKSEQKPNLSLGVASLLRDRAATPHELLKRADQHLYAAKRAGKGQLAGV